MQKRHFIALAAQISAIENLQSRADAARAVAIVAKGDNANFDEFRFYKACGVV